MNDRPEKEEIDLLEKPVYCGTHMLTCVASQKNFALGKKNYKMYIEYIMFLFENRAVNKATRLSVSQNFLNIKSAPKFEVEGRSLLISYRNEIAIKFSLKETQ